MCGDCKSPSSVIGGSLTQEHLTSVRSMASLMREQGILAFKGFGVEIHLGAPLASEDIVVPNAPQTSQERGEDGLTPQEQEDLYGRSATRLKE